jgi:hypothetical protein
MQKLREQWIACCNRLMVSDVEFNKLEMQNNKFVEVNQYLLLQRTWRASYTDIYQSIITAGAA